MIVGGGQDRWLQEHDLLDPANPPLKP